MNATRYKRLRELMGYTPMDRGKDVFAQVVEQYFPDWVNRQLERRGHCTRHQRSQKRREENLKR